MHGLKRKVQEGVRALLQHNRGFRYAKSLGDLRGRVAAFLHESPRGSTSAAIERNTPRRMRWRVILEKKLSTALSQDPEVGVK